MKHTKLNLQFKGTRSFDCVKHEAFDNDCENIYDIVFQEHAYYDIEHIRTNLCLYFHETIYSCMLNLLSGTYCAMSHLRSF